MSTHRHYRLGALASLALALCAGPSFAAFTVIQPTGANYVPMTGINNCGAGRCQTSLAPLTVLDLGSISAANRNLIAADLSYQKPAYTIAGFGPSLDLDFTVTNYSAAHNSTVGGAKLTVAFTAQPKAVIPGGLHWLQIVTDNANATGINGADLSAPKGPGNPENVIDAPGVASPFYDEAFAKKFPTLKANAIPPNFRDIPRRTNPTAAVPTINWDAELFLVSENKKALTIYNGVEWGFVSQFFPKVATGTPEPETWLLMLLGCGLTGAALRRQRRALA